MIINLKLVRSNFYFLDDLTLVKNADPVPIDLLSKPDSFIQAIFLSLRSGIIDADIEAIDLVRFIKDIPTRISLQRSYGFEIDSVEVVQKTVEDIEPEVAVEDVIVNSGNEDEKEESERVLDDILTGSNKQVLTKIKDANLSEDEKVALVKLEQDNKNRAIIIAAINEV